MVSRSRDSHQIRRGTYWLRIAGDGDGDGDGDACACACVCVCACVCGYGSWNGFEWVEMRRWSASFTGTVGIEAIGPLVALLADVARDLSGYRLGQIPRHSALGYQPPSDQSPE